MKTLATACALLLCASRPALGAAADHLERRVVGLEVTHQIWDPDRPWSKMNPQTRTPSGVIVEGPFILTAAEMIADATFIQVEKNGRTTQASARPFLVDPEINLALLEVDTPGFFDDLEPAATAAGTPTRGILRTVRWNDQQFESVASRVKRFEVDETHLGFLQHVFLLAQTDMSGGGWAEPVFGDDGLLVGITVSQNQKQQVRIIPVEIIAKFLERARSPAAYRGFPDIQVFWQVNTNPDLSAFLGQTGPERGVLIRQVPWGSSACGVLKPRDILLSIDGIPIDAEGYYSHPRLGQLRFTNIAADGHEVGETLPVRVLRDGREIELELTLRTYPVSMLLVPTRHDGDPPPFIVVGGLVLRELDLDYLRSWGTEWSKNAPLLLKTLYYQFRNGQRPDRRRIVLLTSVLPAAYNEGYQDLADLPLESINGMPIDSIPAVVEALRHPVDGFHTIILQPTGERRQIVLDAAGLDEATAAILEHYDIPLASRMPASPPPDGGPDCPGDF